MLNRNNSIIALFDLGYGFYIYASVFKRGAFKIVAFILRLFLAGETPAKAVRRGWCPHQPATILNTPFKREELIIKNSTLILPRMYKFIRAILFLFDPEWVHYFSMNSFKLLCKIEFIKKLLVKKYNPQINVQYSIFNIQFPNKVGLAAGFDKNAKYLNELEVLGFGFVEIGTVTPLPQFGNNKPRLFRLPKDKALINRMGFNNEGVEVVAKRLKEWKGKKERTVERGQMTEEQTLNPKPQTPSNHHLSSLNYQLIIGGNIGKNKTTPNELAWKDYEICFEALHNYVDYFVVNVSSPNTPGLRELQEKDSLRKILTNLQQRNLKKEKPKPILLKISPDLTQNQIDDVIDLVIEIKLDGLVATNTTLSRKNLSDQLSVISNQSGGLSGLPLKNKNTEIIKYIYQKTNGQIPIIASGGIFNGNDAKEKLAAGASLVQVWTGFVYEGPKIVKEICSKI
jgi:dihydroorotate dehydrogenase